MNLLMKVYLVLNLFVPILLENEFLISLVCCVDPVVVDFILATLPQNNNNRVPKRAVRLCSENK